MVSFRQTLRALTYAQGALLASSVLAICSCVWFFWFTPSLSNIDTSNTETKGKIIKDRNYTSETSVAYPIKPERAGAQLILILKEKGAEAAFAELEKQDIGPSRSEKRVWFGLYCIANDQQLFPEVIALLQETSERRQFLLAASTRIQFTPSMVSLFINKANDLPPNDRTKVYASLAKALAEKSMFADSVKILAGMSDSPQKRGALCTIAEMYARNDYGYAISWADSLETGERELVRGQLATEFLSSKNPAALQILFQKSDNKIEQEQLVRYITQAFLGMNDHVGLQQFLDGLNSSLRGIGDATMGRSAATQSNVR